LAIFYGSHLVHCLLLLSTVMAGPGRDAESVIIQSDTSRLVRRYLCDFTKTVRQEGYS